MVIAFLQFGDLSPHIQDFALHLHEPDSHKKETQGEETKEGSCPSSDIGAIENCTLMVR